MVIIQCYRNKKILKINKIKLRKNIFSVFITSQNRERAHANIIPVSGLQAVKQGLAEKLNYFNTQDTSSI